MKEKIVLILTATCNVDSQNKGSIFTTEERIKQYHDTLQWLLDNCNCEKYVICDNSGYDFSIFENEFAKYANEKRKCVEYLSFVSPCKKGKSYGETEIFDYILKNSKFVAESKYIFKLTGRIIVKNINSILRTSDLKKCYFRKELWSAGLGKNLYFCECNTVFFGMPKAIMKNTIQQFFKIWGGGIRF